MDQLRASRLAARALAEGLAHRTPDQSDTRRVLLALTPEGEEDRDTFAALLATFVDAYTGVVRATTRTAPTT
ncbi:DNA-binding MarR family transcriptional regulator [Actinokineospora baliensis]|uniref:hypothetical protein n=1 Tax=Actinokineospora baliensis TaxID=547056 RepID=UPI00195C01BC|nr:hypothetical protein [Actinokineospora baliensis]MBM7770993.1 DNA-binding MarR family transcriptional regulator [Actinokineospora baliensis]